MTFYYNSITVLLFCILHIHTYFFTFFKFFQRGVLKLNNNTEIYIQPLPDRFGYGSHILTQIQRQRNNSSRKCGNGAADVNNENDHHEEYYFEPNMQEYDNYNSKIENENTNNNVLRNKRYIHQPKNNPPHVVPNILHIETAIFVDSELFRHMSKNYPKNTESYLIRFVLAMINGVQILYHHPSLGRPINFILKRLEVLHSNPTDLRRSSDIDIYLNSFCSWQRNLNPPSDADSMHFDHAVILTGQDFRSIEYNSKI